MMGGYMTSFANFIFRSKTVSWSYFTVPPAFSIFILALADTSKPLHGDRECDLSRSEYLYFALIIFL